MTREHVKHSENTGMLWAGHQCCRIDFVVKTVWGKYCHYMSDSYTKRNNVYTSVNTNDTTCAALRAAPRRSGVPGLGLRLMTSHKEANFLPFLNYCHNFVNRKIFINYFRIKYLHVLFKMNWKYDIIFDIIHITK